jgi:hypothetical protein
VRKAVALLALIPLCTLQAMQTKKLLDFRSSPLRCNKIEKFISKFSVEFNAQLIKKNLKIPFVDRVSFYFPIMRFGKVWEQKWFHFLQLFNFQDCNS